MRLYPLLLLLLPESTPTGTKSLTSARRGASWLSKPSDVRCGQWREARKRFCPFSAFYKQFARRL